MARGERRGHRVERVGECARDLPFVEVLGHGGHVGRTLLQPGVIVRRVAVAEDVDPVGLAGEAGGELLVDERVGPVGDSGGVAHSGRPSARWTPRRESCEAVEWTCRSALVVMARRITPLCSDFVTVR
jgi:hypothetical protein